MKTCRTSHKDHDRREAALPSARGEFDYGETGYAELRRASRERQARRKQKTKKP
jgi:hypothetical protein